MKAFALVAPQTFGPAELPDEPPPGPGADLARICTHRFPVAEAERAFRMSADRSDGVVKAMLLLDEGGGLGAEA